MHIHNVYFWLKDENTGASFADGLKLLTEDSNVKSGYYGRPASTDRDVVENSYSYGLVLVFADLAEHNAYQTGANHLQFLDDHLDNWDKVVVHDIAS